MSDILQVSDMHLGKYISEQNEIALKKMIETCNEDLYLVLAGDIFDFMLQYLGVFGIENLLNHGKGLGIILKDYYRKTGRKVSYLPGNHDPILDIDKINEILNIEQGIIDIKQNLYFLEGNEDILITHGHVFNHETFGAIKERMDGNLTKAELIENLNAYEFKENIVIGFMINRFMGLLRTVNIDKTVEGKIAPYIMRKKKKLLGVLYKNFNLKTESYMKISAYAAAALGVKLLAEGHDHVSGINKRNIYNPKNKTFDHVVVANSGYWVSDKKKEALHINTDSKTVSNIVYENDEVRIKDTMKYDND